MPLAHLLTAVLTASLSFISPTPGQIIVGDKVTVKLAINNFSLVDYHTHPKATPGQGHIHLWLDQSNPTKVSAIKTNSDTYTFENVKSGSHTLVAELVNNDHSSLSPQVITTVRFSTVPQTTVGNSSLLTISLLAFALLVIALYFVSQQVQVTTVSRSGKPAPKSKRKPATRRARK